MTKFIVIYITDAGHKSFTEFDDYPSAYKWCEEAIESGTKEVQINWIAKTEVFEVKHMRKMIGKV